MIKGPAVGKPGGLEKRITQVQRKNDKETFNNVWTVAESSRISWKVRKKKQQEKEQHSTNAHPHSNATVVHPSF